MTPALPPFNFSMANNSRSGDISAPSYVNFGGFGDGSGGGGGIGAGGMGSMPLMLAGAALLVLVLRRKQ